MQFELSLHGFPPEKRGGRGIVPRPRRSVLFLCALQQRVDARRVVLSVRAQDGVELVGEHDLLAADEELVAQHRERHLVLGHAARLHGQPRQPLGDCAHERLASLGGRGAVALHDVLDPADLDVLGLHVRELPELAVDALLCERQLHGLELRRVRHLDGAHALELAGGRGDGRQGDGDVAGDELAAGVDGARGDGAAQV